MVPHCCVSVQVASREAVLCGWDVVNEQILLSCFSVRRDVGVCEGKPFPLVDPYSERRGFDDPLSAVSRTAECDIVFD